MSDDEDPFEALDDEERPEDDPFAHLDDREPRAEDLTEETEAGPGESLFDEVDTTAPETADAGADAGGTAADPYDDFEDREGDPFEQMGSADADEDEVWDRLADDRSDDAERVTAVVGKNRFCEQCPHFSTPPDAHCTNEGTDIVEFVGMSQVKVTGCPVVAERRELEDISDIHVDPEG